MHHRVTPDGDAASYCPSKNPAMTTTGLVLNRAGTWRVIEEIAVKRIRIDRPRARRERPWREVLPADPRDPDVVRAKTLARTAHPSQKVTGK
jgi:hypothetical protein